MIANNSYIKIFGTMGLSIGLMVILFLSSEQEVHRNNAFIRRYPPHPITKLYDLDVIHNSYYIAGFDPGGRFSSPRWVWSNFFQTFFKNFEGF